jgi:hypothetical protein
MAAEKDQVSEVCMPNGTTRILWIPMMNRWGGRQSQMKRNHKHKGSQQTIHLSAGSHCCANRWHSRNG